MDRKTIQERIFCVNVNCFLDGGNTMWDEVCDLIHLSKGNKEPLNNKNIIKKPLIIRLLLKVLKAWLIGAATIIGLVYTLIAIIIYLIVAFPLATIGEVANCKLEVSCFLNRLANMLLKPTEVLRKV